MKIQSQQESVNAFVTEISREIAAYVTARIEAELEREVTAWLRRERYEKRRTAKGRTQARCQRCGTQQAGAFSRNGHRPRTLVTTFGVLSIQMPRVICRCGGSVQIPFRLLHPYQRWWDDLADQIQRWSRLALSLRQMQTEIGETLHTQVGLHKLNAVQHTPPIRPTQPLSSVPPVVMLDAIWVTLLKDTNALQIDRLGRQRSVKAGNKVCVLVALGLYPQRGRWGIWGGRVAESESQPEWEALLAPLEQRGLHRQRGLEVLIHDGGAGLIAALNLMYPHVPHQRCLFHKLRNLWHAIRVPQTLSGPERRAFKQDLLHQLHPILSAPDAHAAVHLRDALSVQWQDTQPDLIATLQRHWHDTIAFFRVLTRFPHWQRTALRTTSLLERVNRLIRRFFRAAGAYHSPSGLASAVSRALEPHRLL